MSIDWRLIGENRHKGGRKFKEPNRIDLRILANRLAQKGKDDLARLALRHSQLVNHLK